MHKFSESLKREAELSKLPFIDAGYAQFFQRDIDRIERVVGERQRTGIDKLVYFTDGTMVGVEEKLREKAYNDFLFEIYSNVEGASLGWSMKSMAADYLAYWFVPSKTCYLFKTGELYDFVRISLFWWNLCADKGAFGVQYVDAKNMRYTTRSIAVPFDMVLPWIWNRKVVVNDRT